MTIKIDHGVPRPPTREQLDQRDDAELLRFDRESPFTQWGIAKELGWKTKWDAPNPLRVGKSLKRLRNEGKLGHKS